MGEGGMDGGAGGGGRALEGTGGPEQKSLGNGKRKRQHERVERWCMFGAEQTAPKKKSNVRRRLGGATCIACKTEWLPEGAR